MEVLPKKESKQNVKQMLILQESYNIPRSKVKLAINRYNWQDSSEIRTLFIVHIDREWEIFLSLVP